jgi:hypothetical protein
MAPYWSEFFLVALAHLIAVISPGPDFAMVLRQSITFGRRTAVWTSVGIGTGILVHVTYSLLGIGLLVRSSVLAFNILKWLGALYLAWIGLKALRSKQIAAGKAGESTSPPPAGMRPPPRGLCHRLSDQCAQSQGHPLFRGALLGGHQPPHPGADPDGLRRVDGARDHGLVHARVAFLFAGAFPGGLPALWPLV